jgi:hypothetical protein
MRQSLSGHAVITVGKNFLKFYLLLFYFVFNVRYCIRHVYFAIVEIFEYIFFLTREGCVVSVCIMNGFIQLKMTKLLFAIV